MDIKKNPDMKITDVFKVVGQPDVTYVERDSGSFERKLSNFLDEKGLICLITGPSKTGKTTLYKEVCSKNDLVPLVVQCSHKKTCNEIWKKALEDVNFDRVKSINLRKSTKKSIEPELDLKFGWHWLASASTKIKMAVSSDSSEDFIRERILSESCPELLIPVLKNTNYILVIEDFHYLSEREKIDLFQNWKMFVDNEVSVIILETSHRAIDIANSNKDLNGRIGHIEIGSWSVSDLQSICHQGMNYLGQKIPKGITNFISKEAVGLPIIVQQICLEFFKQRNLMKISDIQSKKIEFTTEETKKCMHTVAKSRLNHLEAHYNMLVSGPRERARKYRTYELVLA